MRVKVRVDRLEGELAVLFPGDGEESFPWPRWALPSETKEGSILIMDVELDREAGEQELAIAEELMRELTKK